MELFAGMQPVKNLTVRIGIENLLRTEQTRERLQYDGNRGDDASIETLVDHVEYVASMQEPRLAHLEEYYDMTAPGLDSIVVHLGVSLLWGSLSIALLMLGNLCALIYSKGSFKVEDILQVQEL
jgi:hypothetical protein